MAQKAEVTLRALDSHCIWYGLHVGSVVAMGQQVGGRGGDGTQHAPSSWLTMLLMLQ
jgi:hypothetical protein